MDIVLLCQPEWVIVIEIKIDAGEGDEQLPRYSKWLNKQPGYNSTPLIFLTPTGHEAETGENVEYLRLSYLDLAEIFEPLLIQSMPESIRVVLNQYITTCKFIGGMTVAAHKELLDILKKPENIKIALEIEQQTQFIRGEIIETFGKNIKKILQKKLESEKLVGIWMADIRFWNNDNTLHVEIRTSKRQPNYSMVN